MIIVEVQAALLVTHKMAMSDGEADEVESAAAAASGKTVVTIEGSKFFALVVCMRITLSVLQLSVPGLYGSRV
jgi:hypothetical protein